MRTALVTGAGSGIGAAIAECLAKDGWRLAVLDLNAEHALEVAGRLPGAVALSADVAREDMVEEAFGKLDDTPFAIVNNAGVVRFGDLVEVPVADFQDVLSINLTGAFIVARAAARRLIAAKTGGVIVNLTSVNGVTPSKGIGAYNASKAGLAHLTRHMAQEWGPEGVRVNAVAPGFIDGGMSAPIYADPEVRALRSSGVPLRRLGTTDDVAEAVRYLVSDAASYVTGQELVVDGGLASSALVQLPRTAN